LCPYSTEPPSENYWQLLAEKRRTALDECLEENKTLHERLQLLEEEKRVTEQMLEESRNLVEILKVSSVPVSYRRQFQETCSIFTSTVNTVQWCSK
jgi:TRAP-type C4-dicarboxylate transport system substrate-binding protein